MLWVTTASGRKWTLLDPQPADVHLNDIANNLAQQTRFNGALGHYSVAEHCVHVHDEAVKRNASPAACYLALLHDAHEAYIGDIATPVAAALDAMTGNRLKPMLDELKRKHDVAIFKALGLDTDLLTPADYALVHELDQRALVTERDQLGTAPQPDTWGEHYESLLRLDFQPKRWIARQAQQEFIARVAMCKFDLRRAA